jgi:hypothetical protein
MSVWCLEQIREAAVNARVEHGAVWAMRLPRLTISSSENMAVAFMNPL